ncbi:MAG TPA: DUF4097 family beta strand repeat protein [Clostridiaceae bacterium]|nr:DUF4097 family beta strand repeat protein [Clostridiaceae bacterium]
MSYYEERMLILKMLEEGKITSGEALRLLEALESNIRESSGGNFSKQKQPNFYDEISKLRDRINEWRNEFKKNYSQKDFDKMVDEFSAKAEKLGKSVASTTFGIVDKVIDFVGSFVETNAFNIFGSYKVVDKTFEAEAVEGKDISIEGTNGNILVKKHLENKIVIKTRTRSPQNNPDDFIVFNNSDGNVSLKLNKVSNISVSHEVFLPAVKFNSVRFETTNGKIYVEDTKSQVFECTTKNAPIDLMGVNSGKISVNTRNAKIQIGYVIGKDIEINTNNSVIDIKNIKAENIKAFTVNGKINVENALCYENSCQINMFLKTSNGDIKVNMNDMDNKGYKVKAETTNGKVNLLIPELIYYNVSKHGAGGNFIEAESNGYNNFPEKVNIVAETVNGYIEIVK